MPKYSDFLYGKGSLYGERARLALSAEPMSATSLNYGLVQLNYAVPSGTYVAFKIVRNQDAFPETEDDGVTLFETFPGQDSAIPSTITDSSTNALAPLIPGRYAYYRAWILVQTDSYWIPAGDTYALIPQRNSVSLGADSVKSVYAGVGITNDASLSYNYDISDPHYFDAPVVYEISNTHRRFMDLLPRVITSATNNALDEINNPDEIYAENTALSKFLSAFSFTVDEFLTSIKNVIPDISGKSNAPGIVGLQTYEFGLPEDNQILTKAQKRLNREATFIYKRKGTLSGASSFIESMTGYAANLSLTKNLLLSYEDSTFAIPNWSDGTLETPTVDPDPIGGWLPNNSDITLSVSADRAVQSGITSSLDSIYSCKAVVSTTGTTMSLGTNLPALYGIPITAGEEYSLSAYITRTSSTANTYVQIVWYDKLGTYISQTATSNVSVGTSWTRVTKVNQTAPEGAFYAGVVIGLDSAGTYYIDMVQLEKSATATDYEEPRGLKVFLEPSKTNLITNPTFGGSGSGITTGWTGSSTSAIAAVTEQYFTGTYSLKATSNSTGNPFGIVTTNYMSVVGGEYYSASGYVRDFNSGADYTAVIKYYNDANTLLSEFTVTGEATEVTSTYWTRVTASGYAPLAATKAKVSFLATSTVAEGSYAYFDSIQFEKSLRPTSYFDGSRIDSGAAWVGTAFNSVSHLYYNRDQKVTRISSELTSILPMGTPYYVDFYGIANVSGTFSGIS